MTNKSPIFPIHEPQHFSDSQIDYFQVLEEARKHKLEISTRSTIDNLHFKLQKPIFSKDDASKKIKKTRKRWWKNALHFFKLKHTSNNNHNYSHHTCIYGSVSGPVYLAESRSGASTPYHRNSTSWLSRRQPDGRDDFGGIPYISLGEFNMDQTHKMSPSPLPIYLVT